MKQSSIGSFLGLMLGAAKLDRNAYEQVKRNESATSQALLVVALFGALIGVALYREFGILGLILGPVVSIIQLVVFSFTVYFVGAKLLGRPNRDIERKQIMRTLGFAHSIRFLVVLGLVPIAGMAILTLIQIGSMVTEVVAIRQALDVSTSRAIAIYICSLLLLLVIAGLILCPVLFVSLVFFSGSH
jgi:hypothetical protein